MTAHQDFTLTERIDNPRDIHTLPEFAGEPEHQASCACWCEPEIYEVNEDTGARAWRHRRPE